MVMKEFVVPLSGAAQRLSDYLPNTQVGGPDDLASYVVQMVPRETNAALIRISSLPTISATVWSHTLPAPTGGLPVAPYLQELGMTNSKPSDWYVLGQAGDYLHCLFIGG